jgi:hypothetical protein
MQCRNELDTAEETIFKIAVCYQHKKLKRIGRPEQRKVCENISALEQTHEAFPSTSGGKVSCYYLN